MLTGQWLDYLRSLQVHSGGVDHTAISTEQWSTLLERLDRIEAALERLSIPRPTSITHSDSVSQNIWVWPDQTGG